MVACGAVGECKPQGPARATRLAARVVRAAWCVDLAAVGEVLARPVRRVWWRIWRRVRLVRGRQARVDLLLCPEQQAVLGDEVLLAVKVDPGNA